MEHKSKGEKNVLLEMRKRDTRRSPVLQLLRNGGKEVLLKHGMKRRNYTNCLQYWYEIKREDIEA